MQKIIIFGNSGSGKSTRAKALCKTHGLSHLDLDTLAWQACTPPKRLPIAESKKQISAFVSAHDNWVIEGCYSDLLALVLSEASKVIFMNLPIELCIKNAKNRPWEPHKYPSKEAQDKNLSMLIDWIAAYDSRDDTFSQQAHSKLYESYQGNKKMVVVNE